MKTYGLLGLFILCNLVLFSYIETLITPASAQEISEPTRLPIDEAAAPVQPNLTLESYVIEPNEDGWQAVETLTDDTIADLDMATVAHQLAPPLQSGVTCELLQAAMTDIFERTVTQTEKPFHDEALDMVGIDCQLSVLGANDNADHFLTVADALKQELEAQGWLEDPTVVAYGPTETTLAFAQEEQTGMLTVGWHTVPHPTCMFDEVSVPCQFQPEQQLYTIIFSFSLALEDGPTI